MAREQARWKLRKDGARAFSAAFTMMSVYVLILTKQLTYQTVAGDGSDCFITVVMFMDECSHFSRVLKT